jgi:uncharacterized membrane protein
MLGWLFYCVMLGEICIMIPAFFTWNRLGSVEITSQLAGTTLPFSDQNRISS